MSELKQSVPGGNGTQREIGELCGRVDALSATVGDVRIEMRDGFREVKGAVHGLGSEMRTNLVGCQSRAETERRAMIDAIATAKSASLRALTIAIGSWAVLGTIAVWLWAHVTKAHP